MPFAKAIPTPRQLADPNVRRRTAAQVAADLEKVEHAFKGAAAHSHVKAATDLIDEARRMLAADDMSMSDHALLSIKLGRLAIENRRGPGLGCPRRCRPRPGGREARPARRCRAMQKSQVFLYGSRPSCPDACTVMGKLRLSTAPGSRPFPANAMDLSRIKLTGFLWNRSFPAIGFVRYRTDGEYAIRLIPLYSHLT
jgi:hypothetical protein